jgi:hypothetical protein
MELDDYFNLIKCIPLNKYERFSVSKNVAGSCRSYFNVLFQHLVGGSEENHETVSPDSVLQAKI